MRDHAKKRQKRLLPASANPQRIDTRNLFARSYWTSLRLLLELAFTSGRDVISLPETFILPKSIREVVEQYSTLEFDDYTMDYTRKDLLNGEETEDCWKGFYCIGGDGGEISFYVRKSTTDEKIYAFDMEGSSRPEPYASNIRRFIVMRYNDWQATLKLLEEEEKVKQRKRKIKRRKK